MKQKILSALLALVLVLNLWPATALAAGPRRQSVTVTVAPVQEQGVEWTILDGLLTITGSGAMEDYAPGEAPWLEEEVYAVIIEDSVTHLGSNAFRGMTRLQNVTIGDGVTTMGESVFADCPRLDSVLFTGDNHVIPAGSFLNCPNLSVFRFGGDKPRMEKGSMTTGYRSDMSWISIIYDLRNETWTDLKTDVCADPMEYSAYQNRWEEGGKCGDNLTWYIVYNEKDYGYSNYLMILGTGRMYDYEDKQAPWYDYLRTIGAVYIGTGVSYLGENAFAGLTLRSIHLPGSVREIGAGAFRRFRGSAVVQIHENIRYIGDEAFAGSELHYPTFSGPMPEMGSGVYSGCKSFKYFVEVPEGTTHIPDRMFADCSNMTKITIPYSVKTVGTEAFSGCNRLGTVNYNGTTHQWDAMEIAEGNEPLLEASLEGVIATSGTCGEDARWELNADLTILTITGTGAVTSHPWANASALIRKVVVGDGITSLCGNAMLGMSVVTEIELPETLTEIGERCFRDNDLLTHLELPAGVTVLGQGAFSNCDNLESMVIPAGVTEIPDELFAYCRKLVCVQLHEGITAIGSGAFQMCSSLSQIRIPAGLTSLGGDAFLDCDSLTEFAWPEAVTYIGTALRSSGVRELVLPEGATAIGAYAFSGCHNLETIYIPDSVASFGQNAFDGTVKLQSIHIPEGITEIPMHCLSRCGIREVLVPEGVTHIDDYAFRDCPNLERVVLPESLTAIDDSVFTNCSSLTQINWPSGVKNIGWHQFRGTALKEFTVPATVELVESYAFQDCTQLEKLVFESKDTEVSGSQIFDNTPNLTIWCWYGSSAQSQAEFELIPYVLFDPPADLPRYPVGTIVIGPGTLTADPAESTGYEWITIEAIPEPGNVLAALEIYYYAEEPMELRAEQLSDTTFRLLMPKCPVEIAALFLDERLPFTDVLPTDFYYDSVLWALENGITNGISATEFGPGSPCNRAQVVTFLWRAYGCPEPVSTDNPFVDVQAGSFYEKAVLWAVENGITNGTDAAHFSPNGPCNRASVVTFLWRAAGAPEPADAQIPFIDVPAASWYAAPVLWAVENGITNGISATEFGATAVCNRAQVVTFLYRAFGE